MSRTVYNYDENGIYSGSNLACESPLEPGVFLLPARATFTLPPECPVGCVPKFDGSSWSVYTPPTPVRPTPPTLAERWIELKAVRQAIMSSTDWVRYRHQDELQLGITTTLSAATFKQWLQYWQQLRQIPEQMIAAGQNPSTVAWPTQPALKG